MCLAGIEEYTVLHINVWVVCYIVNDRIGPWAILPPELDEALAVQTPICPLKVPWST